MARTDNLTNFLTDVATAIREKEGTTQTIPVSEFDTRISNLSTKEDLTEELTNQDEMLDTQNTIIADIIQTLAYKASNNGSEEVEADYITDGLVAWFDGYDDFVNNGQLLNKVGTDYLYAVSPTTGNRPHKALGAKGIINDMTYKYATSKDYYNSGYTYEIVGSVTSQYNNSNSSGGWLLAANSSLGWGLGVVESNGRVAFINGSSTSSEQIKTGYYGKRFGASFYTENAGTRGGTHQTILDASIDGSPYFRVKENGSLAHSSADSRMAVMCYYTGGSNSPYIINGELNCIRIYNRKLTEEEIAHNHEIDKKRFKLHDYQEVE